MQAAQLSPTHSLGLISNFFWHNRILICLTDKIQVLQKSLAQILSLNNATISWNGYLVLELYLYP